MSLKTEPRRSPIHGHGLFATRTILRGEFIGQYLARRTDEDSMYTLWVQYDDGERGYEGYGRLRFLNHTSQPNAEFDDRDLHALRKIEKDEEVTISYGEDWADIT